MASHSAPEGLREDPWTDPKWVDTQWTVYRGQAYDLTAFLASHPGGNWLINLALKRDCTGLFESYHLRPEVRFHTERIVPSKHPFGLGLSSVDTTLLLSEPPSIALLQVAGAPFKRLPVLADFPLDAVPRAPYPNDSELYNIIRTRVRNEVSGVPHPHPHPTPSSSSWAAPPTHEEPCSSPKPPFVASSRPQDVCADAASSSSVRQLRSTAAAVAPPAISLRLQPPLPQATQSCVELSLWKHGWRMVPHTHTH